MKSLRFDEGRGVESVLCLGAHCDDIEIGCSGALLKLAARRMSHVTWVVFSSDAQRQGEALRSAHRLLTGVATQDLIVRSFRNGF